MRTCLLAVLICIVMPFLIVGCQPNTEPIERGANAMLKDVVAPAVAKCATELSARTAQLQGQGSLINPGYRVQGYATFGPGVTYNFELNAVGVSANIAASGQADQGQATTDTRPVGNRNAPSPAPGETKEPGKSE